MKFGKYKYHYILLLVFLQCSLLFPKQVDLKTAQNIAKNWYEYKSNRRIAIKDFDIVKENQYNNHTTYYTFAYDEGGFVIVSADDSVIPILGYSVSSPVDENKIPIQLVEWLNNYDIQIDHAIKNDLDNSKTLPIWDEIGNFDSTVEVFSFDSNQDLAVAPLVTTTWSQGQYYNQLCPADAASPADGRCYTGCVATAMGQVMNYWNYPTMGTGSHSYVHPTYGTLSANFGTTTYGWASMPDPGPATTYNTSLATLLYHCGVSVDMNYGPTGSGASTSQVANSLQTYFGYASSANYISRSSYTDDAWKTLLKTELNAGRPMEYRGDGSGGHAFVCDGWQDTDHFHFNWGWGGSYDGYFYMDNLVPTTGYDYSNNNAAIIGIQPGSTDPIIALDPPTLSFYATQNGPLPSNQTFNVTNVGGGTLNWTASEAAGWVSMTPLSGTNSGTVTVSITTTNKTPSTYYENATVSGATGWETMPIYYYVSAPFVRTNTNLIVPDHGSSPSNIGSYTNALDANGHTYDIWNGATSPTASDLNQYLGDGCVIWYTACEFSDVLTADERTAIQSYLGNGGSLFFTGQDLGYESNVHSYGTWYNTWFHSTYVQDGVGLYGVNGVSSDPITDGLNYPIHYSPVWLSSSYWWPSEIDPIPPAGSIFHYDLTATVSGDVSNNDIDFNSGKPTDSTGLDGLPIASSGTAGIKVDSGTYKLVYLAFGFETITDAQNKATLMDKILNWLNPATPQDPCSQNGAIIYNTVTGKFNFCEDGVWVEK